MKTGEEYIHWYRCLMSGIHEPCGLPHEFGDGCTDKVIEALITVSRIEGAKAMQERFRPMLRELVMRRAKDNPGSQIDVDQEIDRILSEVMADKLL